MVPMARMAGLLRIVANPKTIMTVQAKGVEYLIQGMPVQNSPRSKFLLFSIRIGNTRILINQSMRVWRNEQLMSMDVYANQKNSPCLSIWPRSFLAGFLGFLIPTPAKKYFWRELKSKKKCVKGNACVCCRV
jgi:hypothetical protein